MTKKLILILFIFVSLSVCAKQPNSQLSREYANQGKYEDAIKLCNEGLGIIENRIGKNNKIYINILNDLVEYNCNLKNYKSALIHAEEELKILEIINGKEHYSYFFLSYRPIFSKLSYQKL